MQVPEYIAIDKNPGLARHTKSMGVINTDKQARTKYIIQRDKILAEKQNMAIALEEIEHLKTEVSTLKNLVQQLLSHK